MEGFKAKDEFTLVSELNKMGANIDQLESDVKQLYSILKPVLITHLKDEKLGDKKSIMKNGSELTLMTESYNQKLLNLSLTILELSNSINI